MTESLLDAYECQLLLSGCLSLSLNIKEPHEKHLYSVICLGIEGLADI